MPLAESIRTFDVAFLGLGNFEILEIFNLMLSVIRERVESWCNLNQTLRWYCSKTQQFCLHLYGSPRSPFLFSPVCVASLSRWWWWSVIFIPWCVRVRSVSQQKQKKLRHALMTTHAAQRYLERIKFTLVSFRDGFNFRWDNIDAVKKLITFGQITLMRASRFQFVGLRASFQNVTLSTVDRSHCAADILEQDSNVIQSIVHIQSDFGISKLPFPNTHCRSRKFIETSAIVAERCAVVVKWQHVDSWQNYS